MKNVMTKGDIVRRFAAARALSQAVAAGSIEALLDIISLHFQEGGDRVTIQGFGSFVRVKKKAYTTTHPHTGEPMTVQATDSVSFRPSEIFKRRLNNH